MANIHSPTKDLTSADGSVALLADGDACRSLCEALMATKRFRKVIPLDVSDRRTDVLLECEPKQLSRPSDDKPATFDYQAGFEEERKNPAHAAVLEKAGVTVREIGYSSPRLVLRDVRSAAKK